MVSVARDSTVLVIDDENSMREGCRQVLAADGYRAEVAENGEQGLRLVRQLGPRVVLVDLKMPGIGGSAASSPSQRTRLGWLEKERGVVKATVDFQRVIS